LELAAQGQIEDAREQFLVATSYRPDFAPAHLSLGTALVKLCELEEAKRQFEAELQLDPANSIPAEYLEKTRTSAKKAP
jgi:Flp pilus assembly protein TadD